MVTSAPILLVGLGNPGKEYDTTRHNVGFMLLDALQHHYGLPAWQKKFEGLFTSGSISGHGGSHKVLLLKPQTFMNLSGRSVLPAATFFKLKPAQILVVHDELDLPLAEVRQKKGGGDAGHNGLKSITGAIGPEYHRLRIGIGRPALKEQVSSYVLHPFGADELPTLETCLKTLTTTLPDILGKLG